MVGGTVELGEQFWLQEGPVGSCSVTLHLRKKLKWLVGSML